MTKKIFGYLFLAIAAILTLAEIAQAPTILGNISASFDNSERGMNTGMTTGYIMAQVFIISIIVLLIIFGKKWITTSKSV